MDKGFICLEQLVSIKVRKLRQIMNLNEVLDKYFQVAARKTDRGEVRLEEATG